MSMCGIKAAISKILWFSIMWSLCAALILAGTAVLVTGVAKMLLSTSHDRSLVIVLVPLTTQILLGGLFVFQVYLFNMGSGALWNKKYPISLQTYAFALLYGFVGADLILRGLQNYSEHSEIVGRTETFLGCFSLGLWVLLLVLHQYRLSSKNSPCRQNEVNNNSTTNGKIL